MTHIVYRQYSHFRQYFSGMYNGEVDENGFPIIEMKWSILRANATVMWSNDAWDIWNLVRRTWPSLTVEVERVANARFTDIPQR